MAGKVGRPKKIQETNVVDGNTGNTINLAEENKSVHNEELDGPTNEPAPKYDIDEVEGIKPEMNANAYSITRDPETQKWMAISIPYDVKSGTVGKIVIVEQNSDRQIIMERFQILAGQEFMST